MRGGQWECQRLTSSASLPLPDQRPSRAPHFLSRPPSSETSGPAQLVPAEGRICKVFCHPCSCGDTDLGEAE